MNNFRWNDGIEKYDEKDDRWYHVLQLVGSPKKFRETCGKLLAQSLNSYESGDKHEEPGAERNKITFEKWYVENGIKIPPSVKETLFHYGKRTWDAALANSKEVGTDPHHPADRSVTCSKPNYPSKPKARKIK